MQHRLSSPSQQCRRSSCLSRRRRSRRRRSRRRLSRVAAASNADAAAASAGAAAAAHAAAAATDTNAAAAECCAAHARHATTVTTVCGANRHDASSATAAAACVAARRAAVTVTARAATKSAATASARAAHAVWPFANGAAAGGTDNAAAAARQQQAAQPPPTTPQQQQPQQQQPQQQQPQSQAAPTIPTRLQMPAGAGTRRSSQPYQRSPWSTQEVPYAVHRVRRPEHGPGQAPVTRSKHIMVFCQVESLPRVEFGVWFPVPVLHNALSHSSKADTSEKLIRPAASEDEAATVPEMHFCFGADLKSGWALGAGVGVFLVCPFPRTSRLPESTMGHWAAARRRPGCAQSRWWRRPQSRSPRPSLLGVGRPARPRRQQRRQGRPRRPRPVPQPPRPTSLSGRRARTRTAFWMRSRSSHLRPSRMRNRSVLLLPVPLKPIFVACCGEVQSWLDVAVWQRRQVDCSFACLQSF